ncbi:LacI family DNA-binding transcriptional regulator [Maritalea porphyrae]|uniref:LacI family DNA-binding transcriptional regulator n=1 Tax=Maritalea porphyrae TaxID=880732 RepID=UPI0022AF78B3|nr:LacI family DNA-binding transcriptional regulator [Maritalea porphyrae]MCZ4271480.1 LacI family DNA-binding transcriptional regulator [Maritalea porphyrae]
MPQHNHPIGNKEQNQVTIKDLARKLDLSITTISRALNGYSDVGAKTRDRVQKAAQEMGYTPNRNAQRLVTQRSHSIGWIKGDGSQHFVDPHFVEVFAGVLREVKHYDYDVVFASGAEEDLVSLFDRYVRDQSVDGFILELPRPNDKRITYLLESGMPFVVHGREERSDQYAWVDIDNFGMFETLTKVMLDAGHKKIAFINGDENYSFAVERRLGAERGLEAMGATRDALKVYNAVHPMVHAGYQLTTKALEDPKVTAILYSSAVMAVEGQAAIASSGREIGKDLEIATMDDELRHVDLTSLEGQISFVRSPLNESGHALVRQLMKQIQKKGPPEGELIPARFSLRPNLPRVQIPPHFEVEDA